MESNRLTILVASGTIITDQGGLMNIDLSSCEVPNDIHALQWRNGAGHIEFIDNTANEIINELPAWALNCFNVFETARQA